MQIFKGMIKWSICSSVTTAVFIWGGDPGSASPLVLKSWDTYLLSPTLVLWTVTGQSGAGTNGPYP